MNPGFYFAVGLDCKPVPVFGDFVPDERGGRKFVVVDENGVEYNASNVLSRNNGEPILVETVLAYVAPGRKMAKFVDKGVAKLSDLDLESSKTGL